MQPSPTGAAMMNYRLLIACCLGLNLLPAAAQVSEDAEKAVPRLALGVMMKQGEKLVFSPCRDRSYALVEDVSPDASVLRGLREVGLDAGKKLYVELLGVMDGINLKASALNLARTEGRCQQPGGADETWRAAGYGPGWLLVAGGERLSLRREGQADLILPYREPEPAGTGVAYQVADADHRVAMEFTAGQCGDPQGQSVFGWQARVTVDGETLHGCAWRR